MYICLLRHGETDWNNLGKLQGREDVPLNRTGIEQVKKAAEFLKKIDWKTIISSPLSRAKLSAEIISGEIGNITVCEEEGFVEQDYGKASGMTAEERKSHFPDGNWTAMESFETLQNRTVRALLKCVQKYEGANIIIVSHGSAINSVLAYVSGGKTGMGKSVLKNAGFALLEKTDTGIKITGLFDSNGNA